MKVPRKVLYAGGGGIVAAILAYFCFRSSDASPASAPPAVTGQVTSGQKTLTIDTNVLSPTSGQPIY